MQFDVEAALRRHLACMRVLLSHMYAHHSQTSKEAMSAPPGERTHAQKNTNCGYSLDLRRFLRHHDQYQPLGAMLISPRGRHLAAFDGRGPRRALCCCGDRQRPQRSVRKLPGRPFGHKRCHVLRVGQLLLPLHGDCRRRRLAHAGAADRALRFADDVVFRSHWSRDGCHSLLLLQLGGFL